MPDSQTRRLGDVLTIVNGRNQRAVQVDNGPYPIYGSGGVMGFASDYLCEAGATVIGRKGSINNPIFVETRFWNVDTAFGLSPRDGLDPRYLYRFCQHYDFTSHDRGTTLPSLVKTDLLEIPIPLPSLSEQERVVAILDEAFASVTIAKTKVEKSLESAQTLLDTTLAFVFSEVSSGWVDRSEPLAELCELIVDCEHRTAPTQTEGIPSIRTPNIGRGQLILDGVNRVSEQTYKLWTRRAEPRAGDLILAREAPAGNVAVVPDGMRLCLGQRTVLIRPSVDVFDAVFLAYLLLSPHMQTRLLAHSRGATVEHVNMKDIRALRVGAIPAVPQQRELAFRLTLVRDGAERLEDIYQRKLAALDELKQSLLHEAFSGNL